MKRLTNVQLYTEYAQLCVTNMRSAMYHLNDLAAQCWLVRFVKCIQFMHQLGYQLKGETIFHLYFQEREEPDEEERIERQAQEHLEAAARHRDDPMF